VTDEEGEDGDGEEDEEGDEEKDEDGDEDGDEEREGGEGGRDCVERAGAVQQASEL